MLPAAIAIAVLGFIIALHSERADNLFVALPYRGIAAIMFLVWVILHVCFLADYIKKLEADMKLIKKQRDEGDKSSASKFQ